MKLFCIKLILGFANYFTKKDESVYDTFNLIVGRNVIIVIFFVLLLSILISFGYNPFYFLEGYEKWERQDGSIPVSGCESKGYNDETIRRILFEASLF